MSGTWASGWVAGDIVTAAEYKKGAGAIFDTVLGGSAANIDITGIVATYTNLMLYLSARGDNATTSIGVIMRFNNDSGANYDYENLTASAATVASTETIATTSAFIGNCPANTAGASLFSSHSIFIANYAGTTANKTAEATAALKYGTASGNMVRYLTSCFWRNSAAISRITLLPATGNFVAGTRATLYAMGS